MSLLEKLPEIKKQIYEIADEVYAKKYISDEDMNNVKNIIDKDKITIGIVGQMKNGKSTLLNSLIFKDTVLPSATTPMTASLSYIKYGENKDIDVEFYNKEDWSQIVKLSEGDNDSKAYKELVDNSKKIGNELTDLIKEDSKKIKVQFSDISKYCSRDGKYVPITKALHVNYPLDILKEVEIVDTPGFNDPIKSRELRSKEFLSQADVVLVVLYHERPFDKEDRELICDKIRMAGTGKIIFVVNKYDLSLQNGETIDEVKAYIKSRINENADKLREVDPKISQILKSAPVINTSAIMALLSRMTDNQISSNNDLQYHYDNYLEEFPNIKTKKDMEEISNIKEIESEIDRIIKSDKLKILLDKTLSFISGKLTENISINRNKKFAVETEKKALDSSSTEIEREIKVLSVLTKDIKNFLEEKQEIFNEMLSNEKFKTNQSITKLCNSRLADINKLMPSKDFFKFKKDYERECTRIIEDFILQVREDINKYIDKFNMFIKQDFLSFLTDLENEFSTRSSKLELVDNVKFKEIRTSIIESYREDFFVNLPSNPNIILKGFLIFASQDEAIATAREIYKDLDIEEKARENIENIENNVKLFLKRIKDKTTKDMIEPLLDSLDVAKSNLNKKDTEFTRIDSEIKKIELDIKNIETMNEQIKNKIDMITNI